MFKWIVFTALFMGLGFLVYDKYRAGYFTRPDMPEGAFSLSYKNGLRGILVGIPYENSTKRYLGFPFDVPFYLKDAWSFCYPPNEEEQQYASALMKEDEWPGAKFEAVCKIEVGDDTVVRGLITSVPRL